jgi:serine/threonine protein kinase
MLVRAGTVLAERYRLEQRVGSGGMGEVWRAFDGVLGRTVAVKCLLGGRPEEQIFVDQFRAEARIMATISHPGVVEVHDFGDDPAAGVYLVMKYIDGESLAQTLTRVGRLSAGATMRLVAEVAEALHVAHENGVTHRDIKPGNLLLRPDGSALVTDFGIARSEGMTGHTATGSLVGTAGYIAPERALGRVATPASDIYGLGIVAYRCLAGHLPFAGQSVVEIAMSHVNDEAPPLPPDVPPSVREIVERAMAKDPALRWPSGAALAAAARQSLAQDYPPPQPAPEPVTQPVRLAAASDPTSPQAGAPENTPIKPGPRRRGRKRVLAFVAAGLAVVAAGFALSRPGDPQPQSLSVSPGPSTPAPAEAGMLAQPVVSLAATASASSSVTASPKAGTANLPLAVPSKLTATPISHNTVRLQWLDTSAAEDGFSILDGGVSRTAAANATSFDWTGLAAGTHTCFKIRAFNATGVSPYYPEAQREWICATTLPGIGPPAPGDLVATAVSATAIRLQWTDNSADEDGFTINNGDTMRNVGASTTAYVWDGLSPGTYMCFKVRSFSSSGVSAFDPPAEGKWACVTTPAS